MPLASPLCPRQRTGGSGRPGFKLWAGPPGRPGEGHLEEISASPVSSAGGSVGQGWNDETRAEGLKFQQASVLQE
jgi:hypothetical protein